MAFLEKYAGSAFIFANISEKASHGSARRWGNWGGGEIIFLKRSSFDESAVASCREGGMLQSEFGDKRGRLGKRGREKPRNPCGFFLSMRRSIAAFDLECFLR
jgi:hypothetical protein